MYRLGLRHPWNGGIADLSPPASAAEHDPDRASQGVIIMDLDVDFTGGKQELRRAALVRTAPDIRRPRVRSGKGLDRRATHRSSRQSGGINMSRGSGLQWILPEPPHPRRQLQCAGLLCEWFGPSSGPFPNPRTRSHSIRLIRFVKRIVRCLSLPPLPVAR